MVLITDEQNPRNMWPMGLVTDLIPDKDGVVRSVKLKTPKSNIERSINMLVPLELNDSTKETAENPTPLQANQTNDAAPAARAAGNSPQRQSARQTNDTAAAAHADDKRPQRQPAPLPAHQKDDATAAAHADSRSPQRQRPLLNRRAKENVDYTSAYTTRAQSRNFHMNKWEPNVNTWHAWLTLTILTALILPTAATTSRNNKIECIRGGIRIYTPKEYTEIEVCGEDT